MVETRLTKYRFAFTMIELIFAIVIIAISVMSLPMMTQVTSKGIENSLVQEAIFAASAELIGVTAGYWDDNSMFDNNVSSLSRVIDIANLCDNDTRLLLGHINQPYHRRCLDENNTTVTPADTNVNNYVSLDDMEQIDQPLFLNPSPETAGYKNSYTSTIDVVRVGNIKTITSTIKNSDGTVITVLKIQSANIGEIDYFKRTF